MNIFARTIREISVLIHVHVYEPYQRLTHKIVFPPFSLAFHADAVAAVVHYPLEVCVALHFQSIGRAQTDFTTKSNIIRVHPVSLIVAVLKGRNPVLEFVCAVKVPGPAQDEREHHYYGSDESPHDSLILFTSFEGGLEISQALAY